LLKKKNQCNHIKKSPGGEARAKRCAERREDLAGIKRET